MKIVGIIPVRLESSRLPQKALREICGIPMILHVYERGVLAKKLDDIFIATDSVEIKKVVEDAGGKVIMTSSSHRTGTDRIAEAAKNIECDVVINIQGDEALLDPEHIDLIAEEFPKTIKDCHAGILVTKFNKSNSSSDIKAVLNRKNEVLYLSRTDLPSSTRSAVNEMWKAYHIVPFQKSFLLTYTELERSHLELIEYNEYLRILEHGYKIKAFPVESDSLSVDTEFDLEYVSNKMPYDSSFLLYKDKYNS
ncbi:MAG: 3-deoxy-manno-octulosonate cytidylyltransferase [Bacteriovoracaceae bacterium]|nr:3-deoxy-manno-octulosonate cytidylyltransferase [Bacteriovoracaceae bacterium]